uniref:Membrane-associated tyrosine- and threonine-specific cdc2-inhibitory kinase n=1 Tax=Leptobrachium leishanense TaxID=445787 RepID=A0A8C5QY02_9ANUR
MPFPRDEMGEAPLTRTPIPVPTHFHHAEQSFSLKKRGRSLCYTLPPRPPVKSIPPISRIFPNRQRSWSQPRPQSVSFCTPLTAPPASKLYDLSKGETFFKQCFQSICKLGRGSFGEVYKVRSREDDCLYAVKRSVSPFRGESDRQRKLQEVRKHERVGQHPNCVHFVRAWEEKSLLYLQTELCACSLQQYSEELPNPLPPHQVWNFTCDLLRGLKHLHDRNLLHLDIKPANVFMSFSGVCKLGDFGLMVELDGSDGGGEAQEGDPRYMAPELLDGMFGKAADVFSLGMTLLEVSCNMELPKGGEGWQLLRQGHLPTEFTSDLPPDFLKVLSAMLDPDHRRRATVDWLLSLPSIQRAERWRKLTLSAQWTLGKLFAMCQVRIHLWFCKRWLVTWPQLSNLLTSPSYIMSSPMRLFAAPAALNPGAGNTRTPHTLSYKLVHPASFLLTTLTAAFFSFCWSLFLLCPFLPPLHLASLPLASLPHAPFPAASSSPCVLTPCVLFTLRPYPMRPLHLASLPLASLPLASLPHAPFPAASSSPCILTPCVLSCRLLTPCALSCRLLTPCALSCRLLTPCALSCRLLTPCALSCRLLTPCALSCRLLTPCALSCRLLTPCALSCRLLTPCALSCRLLTPCALSCRLLTPCALSCRLLTPCALSCRLLTPCALSCRLLTPCALSCRLLTPCALSCRLLFTLRPYPMRPFLLIPVCAVWPVPARFLPADVAVAPRCGFSWL